MSEMVERAEEQKRVYVVAHDGGYEGYSEPLAVFATPQLAQIFLDGAQAGYRSGMKVFDMPLRAAAIRKGD